MTPFHRFRITLQTTRAIQLPTQQGAVVYALLCAANHDDSQVPESKPSFPGELMTDVPEVCRTHLFSGELFAFGGTILNADITAAAALLERLCGRLEQLGRQGKPRSHGLGGNFRLHSVEDLVSNTPFADGSLSCVANSHLNEEIQRVLPLQEFTLQLCSPVRIERPRRHRNQGSEHVDERYFNLPMIIRMLLKRSAALGISLKPNAAPPVIDDATVQLVEKRIQWLDLAYGKQGKRLGGLVGSIRIRISDPVLKAALVWGQYTRLGKNTAFGFGRYRIRELGPEPFACARAVPLLQTAWNHPNADALSADAGLEAGILQFTFQQISRGDYQPDPVHQLQIGDSTKQRLLQIPSRRDRTLQRLLLEAIGPGCDQLFEASSFAWRRGLGRHSSARAVSRAWRDGFRYAINADFDRFFESIPHDLLQDRLLGYMQDQPTVDLIMTWVRSAAGDGTKGIPTGAPLSPLLGNLLLDRFDELIQQQQQVRLVRYGDDFLILCRDKVTADRMYQQAHTQAEALQLTLNQTPLQVLDFDDPFRFLGFDFQRHESWSVSGRQPQLLEELGWHDAHRPRSRRPQMILPGETGQPASDIGLTAIAGPDATHLELRSDAVGVHYRDGRPQTVIPLANLETLIVLGQIGATATVLQKLTDLQVHVLLADSSGRAVSSVSGDHDLPHDVLLAQADATRNPQQTLFVARQLVACKIHNYGRLASVMPTGSAVAERLAASALRAADAVSLEQLRGIEGAAAATWYRSLNDFLPKGKGFTFGERVAPNAEDPVNVLLNIAHTHLYRLSVLAIRSAGLCSSLGFLHQSNGRHAALASDLQESFRFLMDRCVIEATWQLGPKDFSEAPEGPWRLRIRPQAARKFQLLLWKSLHREVRLQQTQEESTSWLVLLQRQARQLRRWLLHGEPEFSGIRLP